MGQQRKKRRRFSAAQKVSIIREHLLDGRPVSDLCDEYDLNPNMFYRWQKQFFESGHVVFERTSGDPIARKAQKKVEKLEQKLQQKDMVLGEVMAEYVAVKKKRWGQLTGLWVEPDRRDAVVDFVTEWVPKTGRPMDFFISRLGISRSKFFEWKKRYGCENRHNGSMPRSFWLEPWEKKAIVDFYSKHPEEGYRRCCYMMIDADIVATSPSTVYRVLKEAGAMRRWKGKPSKKGTGFNQPAGSHRHWHVDISYLNICGTFYYMCSVLDGYSRYVVHWEIREKMDERDVQITVQRAREAFPGVTPRIISDNGPQFIAKGFKEFIRASGMTHVRTSPHYPQSNGKLERYHGTIKTECIRQKTPLSLEDARRNVSGFVKHYNGARLHSAIGYVTPKDKLEGREKQIFALRDQRLEQARERRRLKRLAADCDETHEQTVETVKGKLSFPLTLELAEPSEQQDCPVGSGISARRAE